MSPFIIYYCKDIEGCTEYFVQEIWSYNFEHHNLIIPISLIIFHILKVLLDIIKMWCLL